MVAITNSYYSAYSSATASGASSSSTATASTKSETTSATPTATAVTSITLSDAAKAALSERSFAAVLADARTKLTELLEAAGRKSPLANGELALDMSSLDSRELYAIASDKSFAADQSDAAKLETQRRMEAALAGPLSIAKVTGNYTGLYNAAATFLDALGPEEKTSDDWKASRAAVAEGLKQLQTDPKTLPSAGEDDPVATYIKLLETRGALDQSMASLAANARSTLDKRYAEATAAGKIPTFKPNATGAYIDMADLSSRSLSAIVLDQDGQFSTQEVAAAKAQLRTKSSAVLMAGLKSASQSTDPTAFSQNVISAFSSLSAEERQAAGWSDKLYEAAVANYSSSSKLLEMFNQLGSSSSAAKSGGFSFAGLLG